jgi:hydrogenase maturation protease
MRDEAGRTGGWDELERAAPETVDLGGILLRPGSRVRLHPAPGGDIFDLALEGRAAVVEAIEQDPEDQIHVAVTLEDDPGRELGQARQIGHRFFFTPGELEPLGDAEADGGPAAARILVAGIGNVFLGDDGFGVEVATRLAQRELPAGVQVTDFGIRGMDLVYALQDSPDAVIFLDAAPRGEPPGTLSVIEPDLDEGELVLDTHGMDPLKVLGLARQLGAAPGRILVVACEPLTRMTGDEEEVVAELSPPVRAAAAAAVELVESLIDELLPAGRRERSERTVRQP